MTKEKINLHPGVSWLEQEERKQKEGNQWVDIKSAKEKTIKGLEEAIEATKRRIEKYKAAELDTSELEFHLKARKKNPEDPKELGSMGLEQLLEEARKRKQ